MHLGLPGPTAMYPIWGKFCDNRVLATRHTDDELYAAGKLPWQSAAG